jgi:hypothetical protein
MYSAAVASGDNNENLFSPNPNLHSIRIPENYFSY